MEIIPTMNHIHLLKIGKCAGSQTTLQRTRHIDFRTLSQTRRNYNRGSSTEAWHLHFFFCDWNLSLKIAFGIVFLLIDDIISVLIFGTVSVLVSGFVLVLFFDLSFKFLYKMMISIILRVPNLEPIWFPISVPQIIISPSIFWNLYFFSEYYWIFFLSHVFFSLSGYAFLA